MGLFDDNIKNADDILLKEYDFVDHDKYKVKYLKPKYQPMYASWLASSYYPVEILWKWYMIEGTDDIKYSFGFNIQPNKKDFFQFVQKYNNINKVIFRGQEYYDGAITILHPLFNSFNEHLVVEHLKKDMERIQENNEF